MPLFPRRRSRVRAGSSRGADMSDSARSSAAVGTTDSDVPLAALCPRRPENPHGAQPEHATHRISSTSSSAGWRPGTKAWLSSSLMANATTLASASIARPISIDTPERVRHEDREQSMGAEVVELAQDGVNHWPGHAGARVATRARIPAYRGRFAKSQRSVVLMGCKVSFVRVDVSDKFAPSDALSLRACREGRILRRHVGPLHSFA